MNTKPVLEVFIKHQSEVQTLDNALITFFIVVQLSLFIFQVYCVNCSTKSIHDGEICKANIVVWFSRVCDLVKLLWSKSSVSSWRLCWVVARCWINSEGGVLECGRRGARARAGAACDWRARRCPTVARPRPARRAPRLPRPLSFAP